MKQSPSLEQVVSLYETGMTQSEVGKQLGVSQKVIWGIMRRENYTPRTATKRNQSGDRNTSWKGDRATYGAFHYRVQGIRGKPSVCSMCETTSAKRYEWANMTGNYASVYDYVRLCKSCHSRFDGVISNIIGHAL